MARYVRQIWFAARYWLRMNRGRRAVRAHLRTPRGHPLPPPTFVQLRLTNLCNLRCHMCGQWGDTGVYTTPPTSGDGATASGTLKERIGLERQLSLVEYRRLLDDIAELDPVVSLFGGEPLLYPDIVPLVREIKQRGLTTTIITNGTLLSRHADALVDAGVDSIAVSFDGHAELHNRIRAQKGSFERSADGVRRVAEARERRGRARPVLLALFPITELNLDEVPATVEALDRLPLDGINVGLRWFVPTESGLQYEAAMQKDFGIVTQSWKGFEFSWPETEGPNAPRMIRVTRELRSLRHWRLARIVKGEPWVSFLPDLRPADVPKYLTDHSQALGHDFCPVPWQFVQVQPDGDVAFCGDFPDYVIGNVRHERFDEVWRGPRATAFRERLANQPLPICSRCCGRFVYGRWSRERAKTDAPAARVAPRAR